MQESQQEPSVQTVSDPYRTHRRLYFITGFLNIFGNGMLQTNAPAGARASLLSAYTVIPLALAPIGQTVIGKSADLFGIAPALGALGLITLFYAGIAPRTTLRRAFDALEDSAVVPEVRKSVS